MTVKITYDPEVDALYIRLRDVPIVDSVDLEEGVTVDLGTDKSPVGIEILDVDEHLDDASDWSKFAIRKSNAA